METFILTPLGAGNSQFVVRVKSTSNNINDTCENDELRNFVLKITKYGTIENHKSRLLFHYRFVQFLNSFGSDNRTTEDLNELKDTRNNLNRQNKVLCLLDKNVTTKIRQTFMELLKSSDATDQECGETPDNTKILVFYDGNIEKNYSILIPCDSIIKLNKNFEFDSPDNKNYFNSDKYELCSIEQNLFNISDFISLNNKLLSDYVSSKNTDPLLTTNINPTLNKDDLNKYADNQTKEEDCPDELPFNNITLELKLKCGLLNFKGIPSLFKMKQVKKRNMNYVFTNGSVVYTSKRESFFEPCNFFTLEYEPIRTELSKLIDSHQNNMRVFIDNLEVVPSSLKDRVDLLDLISESVMRHKDILEILFKLQSLAAGQQFIGSLLYSILHLYFIFLSHTNSTPNTNLNKHSKYSTHHYQRVYGTNPNLIWEDRVFTTQNNIYDIKNTLKRNLLYNKFTKCSSYDIQPLFYKYGLKMIFGFYKNLLTLLNSFKMKRTCIFYTNYRNLSISRPHLLKNSRSTTHFRYNHNDYSLYSLLHDLAYHLITFNKECKEKNKGIDFVVLEDKPIKLLTKTFYTSNLLPRNATPNYGGKQGINPVFKVNGIEKDFGSQLMALKVEQKFLRDWLYLYLCGRVSMDLSAIINIIYTQNNNCDSNYGSQNTGSRTVGSIKQNRILVHGLSFIDIDLKSITNIFKWKYDLLELINNYNCNS